MGTTRGMLCIVHVLAAAWNVKAEEQEAAVPGQESRSSSGGPGRDPHSQPRVTQQPGGTWPGCAGPFSHLVESSAMS